MQTIYEILGFPEKFKVNKRLGKERFIRHSNLTDRELRRVHVSAEDIDVLYSVSYQPNEEIIVLYVTVALADWRSEYYLENLAKAIASSCPYPCLLVLSCRGVIQFFIFDEKENKVHANRSRVFQTYASYPMNLTKAFPWDKELLRNLRADIGAVNSVGGLHYRWKYSILKQAHSYGERGAAENTNAYLLNYEASLNEADKEKQKAFQEALAGNEACIRPMKKADAPTPCYTDDKDPNYDDEWHIIALMHGDPPQPESDIFEGQSLNVASEPTHALMLDFFMANCRPLYMAACEVEDEIDEIEWLKDYVEACEDYAYEAFSRSLDSACVKKIRDAFESCDVGREPEFVDDYNVEDLKAYLYKYFD